MNSQKVNSLKFLQKKFFKKNFFQKKVKKKFPKKFFKKFFLEIIGAATQFNRAQRAISNSSLQSLVRDEDICSADFENHLEDLDEEEILIGDFSNMNRNNRYSRSNL